MTGAASPAPAELADAGAAELTIADLERATGLGKDLLRKWELRYGFPQPVRTHHGQRRYPAGQLERLRLVARLLEGGWRPGQLLRLAEAELGELALRSPSRAAATPPPRACPEPAHAQADDASLPLARQWLDLVASNQTSAFREALVLALQHMGLATVVRRLVPPFLALLGEAWQNGRVEVYQEHWASHCLEDVLQGALAGLPAPSRRPGVLLCTPVGERHTLGLLLAECLLRADGLQAVRLGPQLAPRDLGLAVRGLCPDVVAVSVSPHLSTAEVQRVLRELRAALPPGMPLWLGGSHALLDKLAPRLPALRLARLDQLAKAVADWQQAQPSTRATAQPD